MEGEDPRRLYATQKRDGCEPRRSLPASLAENLIGGDGDARGEVERADERREDGDGDEAVAIALEELGREPGGLASEDEDDVVGGAEWRIPEEPRSGGVEEEGLTERGELALEGAPVGPDAEGDVFPVVEASALDFAFVEGEAEWFDEVEGSAGGEAGAAGVAGVPVDFGVEEDDVEGH